MNYRKITCEDIDEIISICSYDRVFSGDQIIQDWQQDEMPIYGRYSPDVFIEVENTEEVASIMKYAFENNIPVTPRGAGTGLCGGSVAVYGGIMLSTARMNRILEIDEENLTVITEPGVLLGDLKKEVLQKELMYPPDPGEKGASIGGNIMTNAGGMRAIKYGVTRDYVRGMQVVLANGEVIEVGGKVAKNSSGYSLKDIFIGSEGTLGIITRISLKIIPAPLHSVTLLVPFDSIDTCISAVPSIMKSKSAPTAVEFVQREVIEETEKFLNKKFPHNTSIAYLIIMFNSNSKEELEKKYMDMAELCLEGGAEDVLVADNQKNIESIWSARDAFLEAIKSSTPEMDECDVVVPRNRIADFVKFVNKLEDKYGVRIRSFGHAGDGNLHVYVCKDRLTDGIWHDKLEKIMKEMYDKAVELEGQVSGEHGIGHAKVMFLKKSLGDTQMKLMKSIKLAFDPKNILNPGKVCI